jgi:hypothetical protein
MADIFVSYKSLDRRRVAPIIALLESCGWSVWWDTRIDAGETWDEVIERELRATRCVVVAWSVDSVASRWVREEADEGLKRRILVPVHIDNIDPPLGFRRIQSIRLTDWNGDASATGALNLVGAVGKLLGQPAAKGKPKQPASSPREEDQGLPPRSSPRDGDGSDAGLPDSSARDALSSLAHVPPIHSRWRPQM